MELINKNSTITDILLDFGNEMQREMKSNLKSSGAIASGELFQSIKFNAKIMGTNFVFQLDMGVEYWEAVDKGRDPSKSGGGKGDLFKNILKWVSQKAAFGGFSNVKNIKDISTRRGLAYVITRKINKKGTKGNKFFSKVATKDRLKKLQRDLSNASAKDFQMIIDHTVNGFKGINT